MQIAVKLEGLPALEGYFGSLKEYLTKAIQNAIAKGSYLVEGESKTRTPVDTGRLRASIFTEFRDSGMTATVMPTTNYAIYVHENITARHKTGEAKFMENALNAKAEDIGLIFDEEIEQALNS